MLDARACWPLQLQLGVSLNTFGDADALLEAVSNSHSERFAITVRPTGSATEHVPGCCGVSQTGNVTVLVALSREASAVDELRAVVQVRPGRLPSRKLEHSPGLCSRRRFTYSMPSMACARERGGRDYAVPPMCSSTPALLCSQTWATGAVRWMWTRLSRSCAEAVCCWTKYGLGPRGGDS